MDQAPRHPIILSPFYPSTLLPFHPFTLQPFHRAHTFLTRSLTLSLSLYSPSFSLSFFLSFFISFFLWGRRGLALARWIQRKVAGSILLWGKFYKNFTSLAQAVPAQFSLHSAKKWPKTPAFHFILFLSSLLSLSLYLSLFLVSFFSLSLSRAFFQLKRSNLFDVKVNNFT